MRPAVKTPRLTAGLIWQPETGPMPYAAAISPKPKANAIPKTPTLSPATTAVPQPKSTRMKVPINSARYFFMITPPVFVAYLRAHTDLTAGPEAREALPVEKSEGWQRKAPRTESECCRDERCKSTKKQFACIDSVGLKILKTTRALRKRLNRRR